MTNRNLTEKDKREICSWKYDGEYAIYNLPSFEEMSKRQIGFMHPKKEKTYMGFVLDDKLIGFVNLSEREKEVFIGIGIHPDFCGKGYGKEFLDKAYRISKEQFSNKPLYLEVRTWNSRAIKCYQKSGFNIDGDAFERATEIGKGKFYRMVKV